MQDRPRFTGTLLISFLIHMSLPFLVAMLLSLTQVDFVGLGLSNLFGIYIPFALAGCAIGLHPYLIRPVLAALITASITILLIYSRDKLLDSPAILLSTLCAFLAQKFKRPSPAAVP